MTKNCPIWGRQKYPPSKLSFDVRNLQTSKLLALKLLFHQLNSVRKELNMENGEYYMAVETHGDPNDPKLILGYIVDGEKVEIYKNLGTYIVVNTKTEKWLTCLGYEHAHHVFSECVRSLIPDGEA